MAIETDRACTEGENFTEFVDYKCHEMVHCTSGGCSSLEVHLSYEFKMSPRKVGVSLDR